MSEIPETDLIKELKGLKDLGTHLVSFTVVVAGPNQWERVFNQLSELAINMGPSYPSVKVSSHMYEPETGEEPDTVDVMQYGSLTPVVTLSAGENLYHDEDTLFKVLAALREFGLDPAMSTQVVSAMQNKGILFRERMPEHE